MELRQHLQHRVLAARGPVDAVEGEVRPEAVRVRQQRALRLPGRARGVDEQQRRRRPAGRAGSAPLSARALERRATRAVEAPPEPGVLVRAEEHRRLGVLELVGELGRREPRVQRHQDQAGLRAGEEDDDVLGARCRSASRHGRRARGRRRAAPPRAVGALRRARRRSSRAPPQSIATRAGVVRARSRIQRPIVSPALIAGTPSRPRRSAPAAPRRRDGRRRGRARRGQPGSAARAARRCGSRRRRPRCRAGSASARRSPRRGRAASKAAPAAACALPASGGLAVRAPVREDLVDDRLVRVRRERVLDEASQRDLAQRRRARHQLHRLLAASGTTPARPAWCTRARAGRRAPGAASGELLGDHPAEARAEHVRPLHPGLVEHLRRASAASSAAVYGPGGASLSPMPRLSKRITSKARGEPLEHRAPSPSGRSRARGSGAAAHPAVAFPGDASRALASSASSRPRRRGGCASLASPPGTKKTSRMKSVPRMKSGSESGVESTEGRSSTAASRRASRAAGRARCRGSRRGERRSGCRRRRSRPSRAASA